MEQLLKNMRLLTTLVIITVIGEARSLVGTLWVRMLIYAAATVFLVLFLRRNKPSAITDHKAEEDKWGYAYTADGERYSLNPQSFTSSERYRLGLD